MIASPVLFGPLLALLAAEGVAPSPAPPPVPSACPDANAVWAAAGGLVGGRRLEPAARATLQVEDMGARYRVSIAGRAREVADDARDCARRVEVAAVFVALTLFPPEVPQAEAAPAPPPAAPPPRPRRIARLEAAPAIGLNVLAADDRALWAGGLLRLFVPLRATETGGERLGALADVGVALGAEETSAPGRVRERRVPVALGLRWAWRGQHLEGGLDVEAVGAWLEVAPAGGASKGGTLDWGARIGGILALGGRRIMPLVGAFIEASPAPPALALEPDGVVGHASSLRVSAFFGLGIRIP